MDSLTLGAVVKLAEEAKVPRFLKHPVEPDTVAYLVHGERCERVEAGPGRRLHAVTDLSSLAECTARLSSVEKPASVWVSRNGVKVLLDDGDRRDLVQLELEPSPQMLLLSRWAEKLTALAQADIVRHMRNTFAATTKGTQLVNVFRQLRFELMATNDGTVQHGSASVSKEMRAKASGATAIPEEVTFKEPAFCGGALGVSVSVPCTVEIEAAAQAVAFLPLAGAIEAAWLSAEAQLADLVRAHLGATAADAEQYRVYLGAP